MLNRSTWIGSQFGIISDALVCGPYEVSAPNLAFALWKFRPQKGSIRLFMGVSKTALQRGTILASIEFQ